MHEVAVRIDDNVVDEELMHSEVLQRFFEELFPCRIEVWEKSVCNRGERGLCV